MLGVHFLQNIQQNELGVVLNGIADHCREDMITRYTNDLIQLNWTHTYDDKKTKQKELEVKCLIFECSLLLKIGKSVSPAIYNYVS